MSELLTVKRVCELTGLARSTLSRLRDHGKFPSAVRVGPHFVAFKSDDVARWLKANPPAPRGIRCP